MSKKHRTRRVQTLKYLFGFKLTPVGRVAVTGIFLSAVGVLTVEIPIYQIFISLIFLFGIVEFVGFWMRPRLSCSVSFPEKMSAGEEATGFITVKNVGRWPAYDVMCVFFGLSKFIEHTNGHTSIPALAPGKEASLPVTLRAQQRGEYALPLARLHSTFPFNMMRFGKNSVEMGKLVVLPRFQGLEGFQLPFSCRYQMGGILVESSLGDSPEYVGNREYVYGEPVRRLDFRAWARVGKPIVREYQDEFCSRVAIVLDTLVTSRWAQWKQHSDSLEAAVSITAAIADKLNEQETMIDVFAAGPDLFLFQTSTGVTHFDSILEILAAVEMTSHNPLEKLSPALQDSLESISTVVCVFLDWDDSREALTRQIVEAGCSLRVLLIHPKRLEEFPADMEMFSWHSPNEVLEGSVAEL